MVVKEIELPCCESCAEDASESSWACLEVTSTPTDYFFYYNDGKTKELLGSARSKYLSSEVAGGFTGVVMGLYAIDEDGAWAEFKELDWKQGTR